MKFIRIPINPLLYLPESTRYSQYDDAKSEDKFEATDFFQPPILNLNYQEAG